MTGTTERPTTTDDPERAVTDLTFDDALAELQRTIAELLGSRPTDETRDSRGTGLDWRPLSSDVRPYRITRGPHDPSSRSNVRASEPSRT